MNILLWFAIMNGAAAWVPPRIKTTSLTPLAASRTLSEKLQDQVQGAALALTLLTSVTTALPTHAFSNDFAGVPVEAKKAGGLRGKNGATAAPSEAGLGLFVDKNGPSLLRLAVPDVDLNAREVQANIELVKLRLTQVGFSGKAPIWKAASADVARAEAVLAKSKESFVNQAGGGGEAQQAKAKAVLEQEVGPAMARLKEATKLQDFPATAAAQLEAAQGVATVRELMATQKGFQAASGYTVPQEYSSTLPVLEGRATVELKFKTSSNRPQVVTVVVDGYHAPLASGAFVAQAASGNFDNLKVGYNEELIVGMEKPKSGVGGKSGGGIGGGVEGGVPLELFYRSDAEPTYGISQDDDGRGTDNQVLPFQAFGALGMSHPDEDVDGNEGAQFFFVKYDQGLLPPGRNTLDGTYTCFGYAVAPTPLNGVVEGGLSGGKGSGGFEEILGSLKKGDVIEKATVISGLENLKLPSSSK